MKYNLIKLISIIILLAIFIHGCHKKNCPPYIPYTPIGPSIGLVNVRYDLSAIAIDPDGDSVSIQFAWGEEKNSSVFPSSPWVASGRSASSFHFWQEPGTYCVRARAMDYAGWSMSKWSLPHYIKIISPIDLIAWICQTDSAELLPRESHTSVVFHNKMWVIGGYNHPNQVWSSPDGANWTCETNSAGFGERDDSKAVVFDNKIWLIGGGHANITNDVWCSSDGVNWTQLTNSAQWSPRGDYAAVVFNNKIWILGGTDYVTRLYNDVWYSADGINWTCATNSAEWTPRQNPTSVVYDNKIWIMGGEYSGTGSNDVWYSPDGRDWFRATVSAEWSVRMMHAAVVYDDKIWILGGKVDDGSSNLRARNDVWYSTDGEFWNCEIPLTMFSKRYDHTAIVFDNWIWVMGGFARDDSLLNDVWYRAIITGTEDYNSLVRNHANFPEDNLKTIRTDFSNGQRESRQK